MQFPVKNCCWSAAACCSIPERLGSSGASADRRAASIPLSCCGTVVAACGYLTCFSRLSGQQAAHHEHAITRSLRPGGDRALKVDVSRAWGG